MIYEFTKGKLLGYVEMKSGPAYKVDWNQNLKDLVIVGTAY